MIISSISFCTKNSIREWEFLFLALSYEEARNTALEIMDKRRTSDD